MSKIDKMTAFYDWLYTKIKSVHTISETEFENIIEKL